MLLSTRICTVNKVTGVGKRKVAQEWLTRFALVAVGIAVAIGIVRLIAPFVIRHGNERYANLNLGEVEYTIGAGDLFLVQPDSIAPPQKPYEVLSRHWLGWDEDGFRVPAIPADSYSIIALGDSYTEATNVAFPWTDMLARELNTPVRNLGFRGYGPQEEALVFEQYGAAENPGIVIIGFFGGNDISNAGSFDGREDNFSVPSLVQDLAINFDISGEPWQSDAAQFQYPILLQLNETTQVPIAFFNSYTSWLNITVNHLRQSKNLEDTIASWRDIQSAANPDTCIVLAFLPSKEQIYLPYVVPDQQNNIVGGMVQRGIDEPGDTLSKYDIHPTWDELMGRLNNLRTVIGESAIATGLRFVDLSPAFDAAATNGELLYYTYDTHWNQAGHDLAGEVIAEFLQNGGCE
jgi:hypothetical protein